MINKIVLVFAVIAVIVVGILFNHDFSDEEITPNPALAKKSEVKKSEIKSKKDVKIVYKEDVKKVVKKIDKKQDFRSYVDENVKQMHTLSKTKVGEYSLSIKTPKKPKANRLAPPQFPTILRGEINGQKFSLTVPQEAKKQNLVFTITKQNASAVINLDVIKDVSAGQMVDIGNLNPPQDLSDSKKRQDFEQEAQSEVESNTQESQNTQSESIAPPTPPSIGG